MTTAAQVRANRKNAQASTGPKTAGGRARSAKNALRHALSRPVSFDRELDAEVEALTREILGGASTDETKELARRVAEAQIDVHRVRAARCLLMSDRANDQYNGSQVGSQKEKTKEPKIDFSG